MTNRSALDSNGTGLRFCEEISIGVLDIAANQVWYPYEPNTYPDFGGKIKTVARNPINASRQRQKGVVVDKDATAGFNQDLSQPAFQRIAQGFLFADMREKYDSVPFNGTPVADIAVDGTANGYTSAAFGHGSRVLVRSLLLASGWINGTNNGLKQVSVITAETEVDVTDTALVDEVYNANARIQVVGYRFTVSTVDMVNSGTAFPHFNRASGAVDWTTLGLIPGEWVYIGGDATANHFVNPLNNGWARIHSVTASTIVFDKASFTMAAETGTSLQIDMYFGKVLKNEADPTLIKRRTYQAERTLGAPDAAQPSQIQAQYVTGSVPNEWKFNLAQASIISADFGFISTGTDSRDAATGPKSLDAGATAPALVSDDAFNTTSHIKRLKMEIISDEVANPTPLFAFVTDANLSVKNNNTPTKALGVLGAFEVSAGIFEVSGSLTAYFTDVAAIDAVENNSDVSFDLALVQNNAGMVMDLPLLALGNGLPKVELNKSIIIPIDFDAAPDKTFNHTLLFNWLNYLPDRAEA